MKKLIATGIIAALSSLSAMAAEPSFNFVEGGYADWDIGDGVKPDGFKIRGNFELNENFFLKGSYESLSQSGVDLNTAIVGVGYKFPVSGNTALYTHASYLDFETDSPSNDPGDNIDEDGYQLGLGVRSQISKLTQLYGEVTHYNVDSYSLTELTVGVRQNFTDNFGAYLEASVDDDEGNRAGIGLRVNF